MRIHKDVDGFVSDTGGESGTMSGIGGGSEDIGTDEEISIKEEPIVDNIENEEQNITIKEEPIVEDIKAEEYIKIKEEPTGENIKKEEENITIKEEPIDLAGYM